MYKLHSYIFKRESISEGNYRPISYYGNRCLRVAVDYNSVLAATRERTIYCGSQVSRLRGQFIFSYLIRPPCVHVVVKATVIDCQVDKRMTYIHVCGSGYGWDMRRLYRIDRHVL